MCSSSLEGHNLRLLRVASRTRHGRKERTQPVRSQEARQEGSRLGIDRTCLQRGAELEPLSKTENQIPRRFRSALARNPIGRKIWSVFFRQKLQSEIAFSFSSFSFY